MNRIISTVKVLGSLADDAFRLIKISRGNDRDILTPAECSPFGLDSNPIPKITAVFAETIMRSESVIVGYEQENRKALPGEFRIYSTDDDGTEKFYAWLRKDGTMEIGGNTDNMVRYSKLEEFCNELKADHNDLVQKHNQLMTDFNTLVTNYNAHQHTYTLLGAPAFTLAGTPAAAGIPSSATDTASTADITPAKINEIKTLA